MEIRKICFVLAVVLGGCAPSQPAPQGPPAGGPAPGTPERKVVTQAECEAQGGGVVGDIGDGATGRPDYVCPSGKPPIGNIAPPEGGPVAVEGAVCCPK